MTTETTAEPTIKVRQVAIFIPGPTSYVKIAPRYVLPLFRAKWKDKLSDPAHQVCIIPTPIEYLTDPNLLTLELPEIGACEYEAHRLRKEFGQHISGEPLFDTVYSEGEFEDAFNKAVTESMSASSTKAPKHPMADTFAALPGVGPLGAKRLIDAGIDSLHKLANIELNEVAKIVGKTRAAKAQEAAIAALPAPENT